jgi:hypothetical protein
LEVQAQKGLRKLCYVASGATQNIMRGFDYFNPAKQERSGRRRGLLTRLQCTSIALQLCAGLDTDSPL